MADVIYGKTVGDLLGEAATSAIDFARQNPFDAAALGTMTVPVVGDIAGLLADANMYITQPEERNLLNYGLTAASVLPMVPAASLIKKGTKEISDVLPEPENKAEEIAKEVLELLKQDRGSEVTDEMFVQADKTYLSQNYDLPMDYESRMQRAREMGFDPEDVRYSGTDVPFEVVDTTLWTSDNPYIAGMYGENVFPLITRDGDKITVMAGGANWNDIQGSSMITLPSNEPTVLDVAMPKTGTSFEGGPYSTNHVEYMASRLGIPTAEILDVIDFGMNFRPLTEAEAAIRRTPSTTRIDLAGSGSNVRSPTARFDPRLGHLENIGAGIAAPIVTARMIEELLKEDANNEVIY